MSIIYVTIFLLLVSVVLFVVGKVMLARYGFKYGAGSGLGVLFIPGFTAWFSFYKLEKAGKELWISLWLFGMVTAAVTVAGFFSPVQDIFSGRAFQADYLKPAFTAPVVEEEPPAEEEEEEAPAAPTNAADAGDSAADGGAAEAPEAPTSAADAGSAPADPGSAADAGEAPAAPDDKQPPAAE